MPYENAGEPPDAAQSLFKGGEEIDISPSTGGRGRRRRAWMGLALLAAGLATSVVACGGSSRVDMLPVGNAPFVLAGVRDVVQVS